MKNIFTKTETIDFKTFLAGNRIKKPIVSDTNIYGFMPIITLESFFNMTPQMTGLYALVLGAGAFAILSHIIEVTTARNGLNEIAQAVEGATRIILPIAAYGFMLWVLFQIV